GRVLARLLHYAEKATGIDPRGHPVIITVPASFSVLARQDTIEAAVSAGLREEDIDLIDEPIAALLDFVSSPDAAFTLETEAFKNILVFDYGGGTCDVALVRARFDRDARTGLHAEHLAISEYRQLGGDDVDRAVMKDVVWPQLHPDHETLA